MKPETEAETEALTIQVEARPIETKAFRARDRDEAEAYRVSTPRRDRAEALLRLETASRPGHIPHPHHFED